MTPAATYSATALIDRWHVMTLHLSGEPVPPPPPALPGRVYKAPPASDDDAYAAAWDRRTTPATPAELHDSEDTTD